jgi:hypothetical protein
MVSIGGNQSITIPLYDESVDPPWPLWCQDVHDTPHEFLNHINLQVPYWHDAIKIRLHDNVRVTDFQMLEPEKTHNTGDQRVGQKVLIAGYPYGYSALGMGTPTAVLLTSGL